MIDTSSDKSHNSQAPNASDTWLGLVSHADTHDGSESEPGRVDSVRRNGGLSQPNRAYQHPTVDDIFLPPQSAWAASQSKSHVRCVTQQRMRHNVRNPDVAPSACELQGIGDARANKHQHLGSFAALRSPLSVRLRRPPWIGQLCLWREPFLVHVQPAREL